MIEILRPLGQGRSLTRIADALRISYKTAANNCTRIKAKLGAATTADLMRIAIRQGLSEGEASNTPPRRRHGSGLTINFREQRRKFN